ncbi:MAG: hypothetical protein K6D03_00725 [Solobacterium sp.]|nr:hypothetical protein [Solobacterium sp.]
MSELKELMENRGLTDELMSLDDAEEELALFQKYGKDLSYEEIQVLKEMIRNEKDGRIELPEASREELAAMAGKLGLGALLIGAAAAVLNSILLRRRN